LLNDLLLGNFNSQICELCVCFVVLHQARIGLSVPQTHRDLAFCSYAILDVENVFTVEDATQDIRFADSALVSN